MKDLLSKLFEQLKETNGPTRLVVGAALLLTVLMVGVASYRAANPHFTLLQSNLDEAQLASASGAIANAGVRFKTSHGPGPYTIWVEDGKYYEAMQAIHIEGALSGSPRGIEAIPSGAASAFLGSGERRQMLQKRKWQEVEKMLEVYSWVARASINSSSPDNGPLSHRVDETISVVLQLRGVLDPDREQRETVATIVSSAFGVGRDQVVVSDQYGRKIFDGARDEGFDRILDFQRNHDRDMQRDVQKVLDEAYGPGRAVATVHSQWTHDVVESIDEGLSKNNKAPISSRTQKSSTPTPLSGAGGFVGADANSINGAASRAGGVGTATTEETTDEYRTGTTTVHTVKAAPQLQSLSVTLLLDESLAGELDKASNWVKGIVGYDEGRGDTFNSSTARFNGLERTEDGEIITPEPEPVPEPANPTVELLIERGVEIVAALGFLMVLLKSLKKSNTPPVAAGRGTRSGASSGGTSGGTGGISTATSIDDLADEDIDVGLLAKQQISELLEKDPERVAAILSRWALDDSYLGTQ